jgi:pimeloyl-ACP methyl ester carboxylesterase
MPNPADGAPATRTPPETGYAPVNGLQMYYEVHGSGGTPLVLLHGGLFNIDLQFGELLPSLAAGRHSTAASTPSTAGGAQPRDRLAHQVHRPRTTPNTMPGDRR